MGSSRVRPTSLVRSVRSLTCGCSCSSFCRPGVELHFPIAALLMSLPHPALLLDPLLDQHGHAGGAGHDLVIMAGGLADHVNDGDALLIGDEDSPDSLA